MAADSKGDGGWGDSDPSVFIMTISRRLQGEYQLTHGYGPLKASQVMRVRCSNALQVIHFSLID